MEKVCLKKGYGAYMKKYEIDICKVKKINVSEIIKSYDVMLCDRGGA